MHFDPNNNVVKLCAQEMSFEGEGKKEEACKISQQAWAEAANDTEKFISAHYVARYQENVADKLYWDKTALNFALKINDQDIKGSYPSLYLNIAKCYEDLNNPDEARDSYRLALSFAYNLPNDGYGKMIKSGIKSGLERVKK